MIGQLGVDGRIVRALDEALTSHELVKVRFQAHEDERRAIASDLAEATRAEVVSIIGHVATFFRQNPDQEHQLIHIPKHMRSL
jgi:RNA-binding protein